MESDITFHLGKQEAELALKVNSAAFNGDMYQLKGLIRAGADPNKADYDGRSPLVRSLQLVMSCKYSGAFSSSMMLLVKNNLATYGFCYENYLPDMNPFRFSNSILQHLEDMKISQFSLFKNV